ncbi:alpha/beta fold hydrolase [Anaerolineales bacterium]
MPIISTSRGPLWTAIHTDDTTDANPLVLIHGAGGSHLDWPKSLRNFPQRTVYALDLSGHMKSPGDGHQSVADYALDIHAFLESLELDNPILLGHSMGGAIVQYIGRYLPQNIGGLILIATGARLSVNPIILHGLLNNADVTIQQLANWMWAKSMPQTVKDSSVQQMLQIPASIIHGDYSACDQFDFEPELAAINLPTLVIAGSADRMTPPQLGETLANTIPHARLELIPDGGHFLTLEQPERVTQIILNWLNQHQL